MSGPITRFRASMTRRISTLGASVPGHGALHRALRVKREPRAMLLAMLLLALCALFLGDAVAAARADRSCHQSARSLHLLLPFPISLSPYALRSLRAA